jgi:hypothetical protein
MELGRVSLKPSPIVRFTPKATELPRRSENDAMGHNPTFARGQTAVSAL